MHAFLFAFGLLLMIGSITAIIFSFQAKNPALRTFGGVMLVVGIISILMGMTVIEVAPSESMVVFNRVSGQLGKPRGPGINFVNPITTSYKIYDVSRRTYTMSAISYEGSVSGDDAVRARTSGGQEVYVDVTVIYKIADVNKIHQNWPTENYEDFIRAKARSSIRNAVGEFPVESVYQERDTINDAISSELVPAMESEGFEVIEILVRNITFTPEYAESIEKAQIAEVQAREESFRIDQVQRQAEQAAARAEGEANARIIEANAEAQALAVLAQVLQENPMLIQYLYVQNLSDNIQMIALPADSPFIFDVQSLLEGTLNTPPIPEAEVPDSGSGDGE